MEGADSVRAEWKGQTESGVEGADSVRAEWKGQTQPTCHRPTRGGCRFLGCPSTELLCK